MINLIFMFAVIIYLFADIIDTKLQNQAIIALQTRVEGLERLLHETASIESSTKILLHD